MTLGGWIFMLSSVGFVLWLTVYCFVKVLAKPAHRDSDERAPTTPSPGAPSL